MPLRAVNRSTRRATTSASRAFFETASDKYGWLNNIVSVGLGHRLPTGPIYQVFEIQWWRPLSPLAGRGSG